MGWWGTDIMGGDAPCDCALMIANKLSFPNNDGITGWYNDETPICFGRGRWEKYLVDEEGINHTLNPNWIPYTNNDGYVDVYCSTQSPHRWHLIPSVIDLVRERINTNYHIVDEMYKTYGDTFKMVMPYLIMHAGARFDGEHRQLSRVACLEDKWAFQSIKQSLPKDVQDMLLLNEKDIRHFLNRNDPFEYKKWCEEMSYTASLYSRRRWVFLYYNLIDTYVEGEPIILEINSIPEQQSHLTNPI